MSVVTGIMLITSLSDADREPIARIQAWIDERYPGQMLYDVSDHAGGFKHPQFAAFSAGINYMLDVEEFGPFVISQDWYLPERVVLIIQPEDGEAVVSRPKGL